MKKGDIVLIPFPFTDLKGMKNRPAVVLHVSVLDVTVCFISSELKWKDNFDMVIPPTELNGLKIKSLIRTSKIATIDSDLVLGELGQLSPPQVKELNKNLIKLFQLG